MQGSSWLLYITENIFLGPDGFLGMLAPKRYVHDGCHGHSSNKFSLVSLCSHHGHTLAHTVCKVQAGFCTSHKTYSWGRTDFLACSHLKDMCMMVVMGIALNLTDNRNRIDVHLYYRRWYPRVYTRKHHEIYPTGTANF